MHSHRSILSLRFLPDVVIGHDRITGAASVTLARDHYLGSKRVLFIHTSPEEIEWHKEPREDSTSAERAAERKREQLDLAAGASLVVAVGPRLSDEFGTDLLGAANPAPIIEMTPGLAIHLGDFQRRRVDHHIPVISIVRLGMGANDVIRPRAPAAAPVNAAVELI